MLHRELEEEVQAGIPPLKALQNATWLAVTVLREQSELGSIDVGERADMVLVEGDPGKNISDIRRCRRCSRREPFTTAGSFMRRSRSNRHPDPGVSLRRGCTGRRQSSIAGNGGSVDHGSE
jgi:hypothetical protein